ncbi:MAG: type II and III secretion system protein family protein [Sphingomonadaceae bacterium]
MALALLLAAPSVEAAQSEAAGGREIVELGKGRLLRLDRPAASVFVADPEIADVEVRTPMLLYLFGRAPGETSLFAVDSANRAVTGLTVEVRYDEAALEQALARALPGGRFAIQSAGDALILSGHVETPAEAEDAVRIAARFVPAADRARIINRLVVAAPTQVQLRVRVVEMSRDVSRALGFNWQVAGTAGDVTFGLATGNPIRALNGIAGLRNSGVDNLIGVYNGGSVDVTAVVDVLDRKGLVSILAEPNLTALSGMPASFLAGGEFPIPVPQQGNVTTIEYRRFGVSLAFVATVTDGGRIHLQVQPEVSALSTAGALSFEGANIPSLTVRRVETAVDLASGQSFAIAGLIQASEKQELRKLAGLGDIPVIGALLRSRRFEREETELVVIVTPYLVRPVAPAVLAEPRAEERLK